MAQSPPLTRGGGGPGGGARRGPPGGPRKRAVPHRRALALKGSGDGRAVASRGALAAEAAWLWRLKQGIDRRWMRGYVELPEMDVADEARRCGGCAAKVPADILAQVMARLAPSIGGAVEIG